MKPRRCVKCSPCGTKMPDKMGIIGNVHGVNASSRPNPKKLAIKIQKLPLNSAAMRVSSDTGLDSPSADAVVGAACKNNAAPVNGVAGMLIAASTTSALCSCGA